MSTATQTILCFQNTDGSVEKNPEPPGAILAGSFNPLHRGHRGLASVAERCLGLPVAFEISIANVDKPELSDVEVRRRLEQFVGIGPVYVTRAATFATKASLFPNSVLVIGSDTAIRIVDPRYYGNDRGQRDIALAEIREHGCRFLVAGRRSPNGEFLHLPAIEIPTAFAELFTPISEVDFREDVSSSELRAQRLGRHL